MSNLAIYQPAGKAGEYAKYACNFYVGCSNGCTYCYLKKGIGCKTLGGNVPTLKKCFKNEEHALEVFEKELKANLPELQKHGLFLSFTTDPLLPETNRLTRDAIDIAINNKVYVEILTKRTDLIHRHLPFFMLDKKYIAFGFTLTGHDELEPYASTNQERIEAMKKLHKAGFKTFASIEPIIDFESSMQMIIRTASICDLLKIGLESGKKYNKKELQEFVSSVSFITKDTRKIYWKDSLLKAAGINRSQLPVNCVDRDYNIFNK
jgi:DNA repair photolyase